MDSEHHWFSLQAPSRYADTSEIASTPAPPRFSISPLTFALAGGTLGFGLNAWGLPVFGDMGLVFGGVFSLLVAFACGPWYGALAAAIAFSRTVPEWLHWAAFSCYTLEALVIGWLVVCRRWKYLWAVLVYWGLIGIPLVIWTTLYVRHVPFPDDVAIIVKYPVNGLIAALVAVPLLQLLRPCLAVPPPARPPEPLAFVLFQRFGVIAALPLVSLSILAGHAFDVARRREAVSRMADYVNDAELVIARHLNDHRRAIGALADRLTSIPDASPSRLVAELESVRRQYPGFLAVLAALPDGQVVATAVPPGWPHPPASAVNLSIGDREYFRAAMGSDEVQVSDAYQGRGLGQDLIVAISARVRGPDGQVRYVVQGALGLEGIGAAVASSEEGERDLVLLDRTGRVIVSSGAFAYLQPLDRFVPEAEFSDTKQQPATVRYADQWNPLRHRRERYLASYGDVPLYQWRLYIQQPIWMSTRNVALFYRSTAFWAALTAALALVLARFTARDLTQPLRSLLKATSQLTRDATDLPTLDTAGAPTEIAQLSSDVHQVAVSLRESVTQRDRANANLRELLLSLDAKVLDRTAELQKARALAESASRAKTEFLANVSHELRTPLNVILGMSELLHDPRVGPLTSDQSEFVRNIEESGRHLLTLINEILDLSKVEVNRLEIAVQPVIISDACNASLRMIREMATQKHLRLSAEYRQEATSLMADPRRLKQILVNLLTNAAKFTPDGGSIGLVVEQTDAPAAIVFTVWDTGIGIREEDRSKLFQPFMQIDSTLSRRYSGTGLGLALVKRMTELHGGTVAVADQPGGGTRFSVTLPLNSSLDLAEPPPEAVGRPGEQAAAVAPAPASPTSAVTRPPTPPLLLLGEDNMANIALLTYYARSRSWRIAVARTGLEVLSQAQAERPALILMDLNMPEMDGREATRRLKEDPLTRDIPVVFLTAAAMEEDRVRCLAVGAADYLTKPVDLTLLTATISRLLATGGAGPAATPSS